MPRWLRCWRSRRGMGQSRDDSATPYSDALKPLALVAVRASFAPCWKAWSRHLAAAVRAAAGNLRV